MSRTFRRYAFNLLLVCVSLLVTCMVMEIALRVMGVVNTGSFYTGDLERGWTLRPGADGWDLTEAKEHIRINTDGLRDREHVIQKPANTLRIAVLGDSYPEAFGVPMEGAFWAVLERGLSSCPRLGSRHVEVINFGVSGYGTAQELLMLRRQVWKYSPDIVLLAFYAGNDFFDNYRALHNSEDRANTPYFVYKGDKLELDDSFRSLPNFSIVRRWLFDVRGNLQNRSRLLQLIMKAVANLKLRNAQKASTQIAGKLGVGDQEDLVYLEPTDPRMKEAWRVTEGEVLMMNDEVRSHGAEFWIATLANRAQLLPDENQRAAFLQRLGLESPFYPEHRFRALAERAGISIITLAIPLAEYAVSHHVYLNGGQAIPLGNGHWNEIGHRVAGEVLSADICSCSQRLSGQITSSSCETDAISVPLGKVHVGDDKAGGASLRSVRN